MKHPLSPSFPRRRKAAWTQFSLAPRQVFGFQEVCSEELEALRQVQARGFEGVEALKRRGIHGFHGFYAHQRLCGALCQALLESKGSKLRLFWGFELLHQDDLNFQAAGERAPLRNECRRVA